MKPNLLFFIVTLSAMLHVHGASIIEFATTNVVSDEFASTTTVTVVRLGSTTGADTVTVSTTNGTAIAGEDYEPVSIALTFAAGETNKVVAIPLIADYWAEPDETFLVHLSGLTSDATSGKPVASVVIRDDERPGSIDLSWTSTLGLPPQAPGDSFYAPPIIQPDGKFIVAKVRFASHPFQETDRQVIRLNADGTMDSTFTPITNKPYSVSLMPDGKIIAAEFVGNNPFFTAKLERYNSDGTPDETFTANVQGVLRVVGLPSGKMLLLGCRNYYGGRLNRVDGTAVRDLARLNNDGSLDAAFSAPAEITFFDFGSFDRRPIVVLPGGKVLVGGETSRLVYLLNEDGSPDPNFAVGAATPWSGNNPVTLDLAVQADGKILVAGCFGTFNGTLRNGIMRLNPVGTVDETFVGIGPGWATALDLLPNGLVLMDGTALNPDGTLNQSFEIQPLNYYRMINDQIVFATEWGLAQGRLRTELPLRIVSHAHETNGTTRLTANALPNRSYTLQASGNLANWTDLATQPATTNRIEFTDTPTNSPAMRFYRLKGN